MTIIRDLWSMLRGPKSGFGPRGPASCEPASRLPCAIAGAVEQFPAIDFEHPTVPEPDPALLRTAGEKMLRAARVLGRTPALAVMQIDELPEIELVFGHAAADRVIDAVMAELTRAAVGKGLVVRTAADTFALLMPGGGAGATIAALQARFGTPCTIEVGSGRDEILAVPDVMVHPLGPEDSIAQAYDDLCRYIAKARKQTRSTRNCVQQPAACGTVAMRSPVGAAIDAKASQYWPPLPATIPVPLGLH